jgi:hypothetical protein
VKYSRAISRANWLKILMMGQMIPEKSVIFNQLTC